jgi:hypothetical protein
MARNQMLTEIQKNLSWPVLLVLAIALPLFIAFRVAQGLLSLPASLCGGLAWVVDTGATWLVTPVPPLITTEESRVHA